MNMVHLCEDALMEILIRLPSASVLRCRAVCRRWRRIATDPSFLAAHAARRPREMVIRSRFQDLAVRTVYLRFDDDEEIPGDGEEVMVPFCWLPRGRFLCDLSQRAADGTVLLDRCHDVVYALDGLLVLREGRGGRFVVVNPTTRQSVALPELASPDPCVSVYALPCGFYLHKLSNEYRLLCYCKVMERRRVGTEVHATCHDTDRFFQVVSVGGDTPRRLPGRAPAPTTPIPGYEVPVAHRGSLHWLAEHPEAAVTGKMLAFHTASETLRLMARPPLETALLTALFELDGETLGVVALRGETSPLELEVWAMRDYEGERWALRHRVEVPPPMTLGDSSILRMSMAINVGGGAVLMGHPGCGVARLYGLREKRMLWDVEVSPDFPTFLVFHESLVPHAFFKSPPPRCSGSEHAPISFTDPYRRVHRAYGNYL